MDYLLKGVLIGLLFGVPAGAVGALTVQRAFRYGARAGLFTGLGSSVADCFYAGIGAFGITLISDFLLHYQTVITLLGGALILFLGIRMFLQKNNAPDYKEEHHGYVRMFLSSFVIGITNPAAILTFLFAFTYFGISGNLSLWKSIFLVCGVFVGTYLWWGLLTGAVNLIKKRTSQFKFYHMNHIFGSILCLFGAMVLLRLLIESR